MYNIINNKRCQFWKLTKVGFKGFACGVIQYSTKYCLDEIVFNKTSRYYGK